MAYAITAAYVMSETSLKAAREIISH